MLRRHRGRSGMSHGEELETEWSWCPTPPPWSKTHSCSSLWWWATFFRRFPKASSPAACQSPYTFSPSSHFHSTAPSRVLSHFSNIFWFLLGSKYTPVANFLTSDLSSFPYILHHLSDGFNHQEGWLTSLRSSLCTFPGISWTPPQNILLWRVCENQLWMLPLPSRSLRGYHSLRCVSAKCLTKPFWFSPLSAPALGQLASVTSVYLLSCVTYNPSSLLPFTFRPSHLRPWWNSPLTQKWAPYQWEAHKPWTKMNQGPHFKLLPLHDPASDTVSMPFGLYSSISKIGTRRFSFDLENNDACLLYHHQGLPPPSKVFPISSPLELLIQNVNKSSLNLHFEKFLRASWCTIWFWRLCSNPS